MEQQLHGEKLSGKELSLKHVVLVGAVGAQETGPRAVSGLGAHRGRQEECLAAQRC